MNKDDVIIQQALDLYVLKDKLKYIDRMAQSAYDNYHHESKKDGHVDTYLDRVFLSSTIDILNLISSIDDEDDEDE